MKNVENFWIIVFVTQLTGKKKKKMKKEKR
jgi:hypothetical protein